MSAYVHPSALINPGFTPAPFTIIDENAAVFEGVTTGSFVRIMAGAKIRQGCVIGNHVTICEDADLGEGVVVADFAIVGKRPKLGPKSTAKAGPLPGVVVGARMRASVATRCSWRVRLSVENCIVGDNAGIRERCTIGDRRRRRPLGHRRERHVHRCAHQDPVRRVHHGVRHASRRTSSSRRWSSPLTTTTWAAPRSGSPSSRAARCAVGRASAGERTSCPASRSARRRSSPRGRSSRATCRLARW